MRKKISLAILKRIEQYLYSFKVNVRKNPEFLSEKGTYCHRNVMVAKAALGVTYLMNEIA